MFNKKNISRESSCLMVGVYPGALISFRGPLLADMKAAGLKLYAAAGGKDEFIEEALSRLGVPYHALSLSRAGCHPLREWRAFCQLYSLIRRLKPGMVFTYTIKPNIYATLAARLNQVPQTVVMVEGLGDVFVPSRSFSHAVIAGIARFLYRLAFSVAHKVFFLNPDDMAELLAMKYVRKEQAVLLNGIGVDLEHYKPLPLPVLETGRTVFLMASRLLVSKGVRDYVRAARILKDGGSRARFILAGAPDENPDSVSLSEIEAWQKEGVIDYRGHVEDIRTLFREADVFVHPSYYREGLPRGLLEAMACGRMVITTDTPGCREAVDRGVNLRASGGFMVGENGILVPCKNSSVLAEAMAFASSQPVMINEMGQASRSYAEKRFDVRGVNKVILQSILFSGQ